jgi:cytochrome P450
MIPTCAKDGADQLDATRIARRLIALLTPLIFATCYVFAHCVLDLHGSPDKDDFLQGLFSECHSVSNKHNGLTSKAAVDSLYRIDSALRESMRTSDVAVVNLFRDVTSGQVNIGNGIHVPQGVRFVFPTQNIHLDPDNYEDPLRYDAFRFSRKYEGLNDAAQQEIAQDRLLITTPTPTFLPFGYGRHACPGRWFAANTMKQALAYIVMNYDLELIGKPIKRQALLNTMVPPVDAKMRIRRKAQDYTTPRYNSNRQ